LFRELLPDLVAGLVPIAILVLIVAGATFNLVAWQPPILQTTQFGTANSDNGITAIAADSTGVYAAGYVGYGNATAGYLFLDKYNLNGGLVWSDHFDNTLASIVLGGAVGTAGVYVVGWSYQTSYVTEYDLNGNLVWNDQYENWSVPGVSGSGLSVSAAPTSLYVSGANGTEYVVKDYDLNGTPVWARLFGNSAYFSYVYANTADVYVAGVETFSTETVTGTSIVEMYSLNGTLVWTHTCSCIVSAITGDSTSAYVVGSVRTAGGVSDGLVARYDSGGDQLWNRTFSAPTHNDVVEVEASADSSGVYVSATTGAGNGVVMKYDDGLVMKYDDSGSRIWYLQLPWETGHGIASITGDVIAFEGSSVYVGGNMKITSNTNNAFLATVSNSSSLVFFGVNPPISFGVLGVLVAVAVISILVFRRQQLKRRRPPSTTGGDRLPAQSNLSVRRKI
jgi:hypothetical protein